MGSIPKQFRDSSGELGRSIFALTQEVVSFIERRQQEVIERILRHCGLWEGPLRTLATVRAPPLASTPSSTAPGELELLADGEFLEYQRRENQENQLGELQLVFDPEFL